MPQRNATVALAVLDEFISIDVPNVTPFTAHDKTGGLLRILIVTFGVGMTTTRNQIVSFSS